MEVSYFVRVDTLGGHRVTYSFDTLEQANAFVIGCQDRIVSGPTRVISYTDEEAD